MYFKLKTVLSIDDSKIIDIISALQQNAGSTCIGLLILFINSTAPCGYNLQVHTTYIALSYFSTLQVQPSPHKRCQVSRVTIKETVCFSRNTRLVRVKN